MNYTWVDYFIFGIFLFSALLGLARGLLREIISALSLLLALVVMIKFTMPLSALLYNNQGALDVIASFMYYFNLAVASQLYVVAVGVSLLLLFVAVYTTGEAINFYANLELVVFPLAWIGRILGAALGLMRVYVFNLILILVVQLTPIVQEAAWTQSVFVPQLQPKATQLGNLLNLPGGFPKWAAPSKGSSPSPA